MSQGNLDLGRNDQSQIPEDERLAELKAAHLKAAHFLLFPLSLSLVSMILSYFWFTLLSLKTEESSHAINGELGTKNETDPTLVSTFKRLAKGSQFHQIFQKPKAALEQHLLGATVTKPEESATDSLVFSKTATLRVRLQPDRMHSGGEMVVEALRLSGVERLFGIPGVQNLALYNAICRPQDKQDKAREDGEDGEVAMHLIGNEEAAAYMAWGVWHKEKRLGCACLIGGPGVTHALAGVACAFRDGTPMIVLTAGVRAGNERFQLHDVDNLAVLKPVCKALFRPASVEEISSDIAKACKCALEGRPGPVGVEIACDLYNKHGSFEWESTEDPQRDVQESALQPRPAAAALAAHASDPMVSFIQSLSLQAKEENLNCILVAEPGYCAEIAAVAWELSDSAQSAPSAPWQLLCPGCGSRPSSFAAESPGVALPSAIGVARGEAREMEGGAKGVVVAFLEARALVPQGLELSHAQGLPLLLVVLNDQTVDALLMAKSILSGRIWRVLVLVY